MEVLILVLDIQERQSKLDEIRSQFTNLYVKNLDTEVTQEEFTELFEQYGKVTSSIVQTDEEGNSKGFGFVNFETHEEAQQAVDALHDTEYKGKKLFVSRAQKKAEREEELRRSYEQAKMEKMSKYQGVNLYIKNLDDEIDDERLRAEFEPFGAITSAKVMRDEKGTSKGFGFVCFSSPDEATKAVAEMNNKMIGAKPLYVSLAQRREVRRQQLESQIAQRNQIRMQQAAAAGGMPGYMNGPMYYPPGGFPPQGGRGMMGYGQPGMMPPRPRYAPNGQVPNMPMGPGPYGQGPPGPYPGMPYGRGGPRPGPASRGPPADPNAPRPAGPPAASVPNNRAPPAGAPASAPRAPQAQQVRPQQGRPALPAGQTPAATPAASAAAAPAAAQQGLALDPATLTNLSPMEQKQMIGEAIYMQILP
jgi:polyadenylate-binding protein